MKKIKIIQYSKEPSGTTLGAYLYHYGIDYGSGHYYSTQMTEEGMMYLKMSLKVGNEVEFEEVWKRESIK